MIHDQFFLRPIIVFFCKTARKREKGAFSVATIAIEVQRLCLLHLLATVPLLLHRSASHSHAPLVVITRAAAGHAPNLLQRSLALFKPKTVVVLCFSLPRHRLSSIRRRNLSCSLHLRPIARTTSLATSWCIALNRSRHLSLSESTTRLASAAAASPWPPGCPHRGQAVLESLSPSQLSFSSLLHILMLCSSSLLSLPCRTYRRHHRHHAPSC